MEGSMWKDILHFSLLVFFCGLIVITVVGNVLIIAAVITTNKLRTITNYFVMSLALADLLVGITVMPLAAIRHYNQGCWIYSQLVCTMWQSCDVFLSSASILSLCAISVDRYWAITQPVSYSTCKRSKSLATNMTLFAWGIAIIITCPIIFWFNNENIRPKGDCANDSCACEYSRNKIYVVFSATGSYIVPLIIMLFVYGRIFFVIGRRNNNLRSMFYIRCPIKTKKMSTSSLTSVEPSSPTESINSSNIGSASNVKGQPPVKQQFNCNRRASGTIKLQERKTAMTLSIVVGGFIICWLPFFLVYLANPFMEEDTYPAWVFPLFTWLGWFNSAVNPFIYALYSPAFRSAFWRLTLGFSTTRQDIGLPPRNSSRRSQTRRNNTIVNSQR